MVFIDIDDLTEGLLNFLGELIYILCSSAYETESNSLKNI